MGKQAILCVDDEVIILLSLIQELKVAFGTRFLYEQATNAQEALNVVDELSQEGVEVIFIISDWLMPGMKGDEFLEIVHQRFPGIKQIMITGQADGQAIERVRTNEAVLGVFGKPWNSRQLIDTIAKYTATE
jgi:DNA-binding NtrC family response regulator